MKCKSWKMFKNRSKALKLSFRVMVVWRKEMSSPQFLLKLVNSLVAKTRFFRTIFCLCKWMNFLRALKFLTLKVKLKVRLMKRQLSVSKRCNRLKQVKLSKKRKKPPSTNLSLETTQCINLKPT